MHFFSTNKIDLTGEFVGFVRNDAGKKRMLVRTGTDLVPLKVSKTLRKAFESRLAEGTRVAVLGIEHRDMAGASKYVASHLRILSPLPTQAPDACAKCSIRVCAKKNCWKNGGEELFEQLEARISQLGLQDVVKIKAVGCLDHCKHGPNIECHKKLLDRCDTKSIDELLARVVPALREPHLL
jgi:hypothetical protein